MKQKLSFGKIVTLGFALFAMFFGAGNLILPPALGTVCGENWFAGFLMYILIDAGLSVIALLAFVKAQGGFSSCIAKQLTPKTAFILTFVNTLFLGPLIAIPRTAATTFDIAIKPLIGTTAPWITWLFGAVYFGLVALLCLKPGKVVDIIGKILSPLMFVALLILIIIGILFPMDQIVPQAAMCESISYGLKSGYQTMDMLGAVLLGVIALLSVKESGFTDTKSQMKLVGLGGVIAGLGLFIVYGGLSYLGATASGDPEMVALACSDRPGLLIRMSERLVGPYGSLLLGLIVAAACLTTAIGLVSACSQNLCEITNGKLPYRPTMFAIIGISYLLSNLGTEMILTIAAPVLSVIFPIYIVLVFLSFLPERIRERTYAAPMGTGLALVVTIMTELDQLIPYIILHTDELPLAEYGLGWLLPALGAALIGGLIGTAIPRKRQTPNKDQLTSGTDMRFPVSDG
ncbi:MAG: branched-chain amino acid transport system II carrier protein [Clostridia bacterium]|nr:branched-chain amino acid transport system II carrier protein [Clostridia bacterium]